MCTSVIISVESVALPVTYNIICMLHGGPCFGFRRLVAVPRLRGTHPAMDYDMDCCEPPPDRIRHTQKTDKGASHKRDNHDKKRTSKRDASVMPPTAERDKVPIKKQKMEKNSTNIKKETTNVAIPTRRPSTCDAPGPAAPQAWY